MPLHIGTCSWNYDSWVGLVCDQPELPQIAAMVSDLIASGREVRVDVNNHYEGSAPESIERLKGFLL